MGFFVPANPHVMGIRVWITTSKSFVRANVLQLGDTRELMWSYNPHYESYIGGSYRANVSRHKLLQTSYSVILRVICVKNHVVLVRTSANKKRSCINL